MVTEEKLKLLGFYNKGLELYKIRKWEEAIGLFKQALELDANDGPSKLYVKRCEHYVANPPDENWEPITTMETK